MTRHLTRNIPDLLIACGVVAVAVGFSLWNLGAALVVGGVELVLVGLLLAVRGRST